MDYLLDPEADVTASDWIQMHEEDHLPNTMLLRDCPVCAGISIPARAGHVVARVALRSPDGLTIQRTDLACSCGATFSVCPSDVGMEVAATQAARWESTHE